MGRRAVLRLVLSATAFTVQRAPAAAQDLTARFSGYHAQSTQTVDHGEWKKLLAAYVAAGPDRVNRVDYRRFQAQDHARLRRYLASLQAVAVSSLSRPEQFAFWVNLYNAATVDIVLAHYPVASIRDIGSGLFARGPWGRKIATVEGVALSLDDIEHNILRPIWRDPRIHYAVNCASIGCPNLASVPYVAARLEAMLNAAARDYVNHPRGLSVGGGSVRASQIYDWYAADFGGSDAGVLRHVRRYAGAALAQSLSGISRIERYDYDWRLNDTATPAR
jgi:hypothetical protein